MLVLTFLQFQNLRKTHQAQLINLQLNNYLIDHTPPELSASGTLLCISKRLSYQLRNDLKTL